MAAVIKRAPSAPPPRGLFAFFKDGVVFPARNRSLFLPLVALHTARSTAAFFAKTFALRFPFSGGGGSSMVKAAFDYGVGGAVLFFAFVVNCLADGRWYYLLHAAGAAAYLLAHVTLGLAIHVATVTAAVALDEGRRHTTLASLLRKVKGNLRGPMATAVYVGILGWALAGALLLLVLAVYLAPGMAVAVLLFQTVAVPCALFYDVVWRVAVVGSVAEPGLRTAAACGRARRLMRGGGRKVAQAMLYSLLVWALRKAIWKVHAVTMARCSSCHLAVATFPLDAVVVYLLLGCFEVLSAATLTAYYFDCRRTEEEKAGGHTE